GGLHAAAAGVLVQQPAGNRFAQVNAAGEDPADSQENVHQRLGFHDITFGTGGQGHLGIDRLGVNAEDQYRNFRVPGTNVFERLHAVAVLESQIQKDDVRLGARHAC